ncbi:hypothetical protein [Neobacillus sp. MER 74]|nr:hypothetical protein [Neobacillus sp. MER 74]
MVDRYINIIPKGRGGGCHRILASDKATFITGQVISVNGGSTMQ